MQHITFQPGRLDPLKCLLGNTATSEFCDKLLSGSINLDGMEVDEATRKILSNLDEQPNKTLIDTYISEVTKM